MKYELEYNKKRKKESILYVIRKAFLALMNRGFLYFIFTIRNRIVRLPAINSFFIKNSGKFNFEGNLLDYCTSKVQLAFSNERTVEIPVVLSLMKSKKGKILEIGNVINKYSKFKHDIVDKYEKNKGIINADVVDYTPEKKYDLVISISTLEHVGFDEMLENSRGFVDAIENIKKNCLVNGGSLIFTVPFGYNANMDKILKENKIKVDKKYYFKRISLSNKWIETKEKDAFSQKYNFPYECANSILMGVIKK